MSSNSLLQKSLSTPFKSKEEEILEDLIVGLSAAPGVDASQKLKMTKLTGDYNQLLTSECGNLVELAVRAAIPTMILTRLQFEKEANFIPKSLMAIFHQSQPFKDNKKVCETFNLFMKQELSYANGTESNLKSTKYHKLVRDQVHDIYSSWTYLLNHRPASVFYSSVPAATLYETSASASNPNIFGIKNQ